METPVSANCDLSPTNPKPPTHLKTALLHSNVWRYLSALPVVFFAMCHAACLAMVGASSVSEAV